MNEKAGAGWRLSPPPPVLYKYRSLSAGVARDFTRDIIVNSRLWFAQASSFNDPFDSYPFFTLDSTPEQYEAYLRHVVDKANTDTSEGVRQRVFAYLMGLSPEQIAHQLQQASGLHLQGLAVCCLSAVNDQVLMWSHYADSHAGICLRFRTRPLSGDIPDLAYRVSYSADRPVVNRATATEDYAALFDAMLVKADFWEYEQEHRLFRREVLGGAGLESFSPDRLDGIIFGVRCGPDEQALVRTWVEERGLEVEFLKAVPDARQFRVSVQPV
ncbi:DUF2971 domain-containing protein [Brevundimonas sp.]|uniref:DUF2971 domain-containing protein n=1 Tax=Brevundimonas sp. TaxID=1871086 RepID=UPI003568672B